MPACWHVEHGISNSALVHPSVPDDSHSAASIRPPVYVAHRALLLKQISTHCGYLSASILNLIFFCNCRWAGSTRKLSRSWKRSARSAVMTTMLPSESSRHSRQRQLPLLRGRHRLTWLKMSVTQPFLHNCLTGFLCMLAVRNLHVLGMALWACIASLHCIHHPPSRRMNMQHVQHCSTWDVYLCPLHSKHVQRCAV